MHAHILMAIFAAILFYALIPGILVSVPSNGTQAQQNMVHAVVYALAFYFLEPALGAALVKAGIR